MAGIDHQCQHRPQARREGVLRDAGTRRPPETLDATIISAWSTLIAEYQALHADDLVERKKSGKEPTDFSARSQAKRPLRRMSTTRADGAGRGNAVLCRTARRPRTASTRCSTAAALRRQPGCCAVERSPPTHFRGRSLSCRAAVRLGEPEGCWRSPGPGSGPSGELATPANKPSNVSLPGQRTKRRAFRWPYSRPQAPPGRFYAGDAGPSGQAVAQPVELSKEDSGYSEQRVLRGRKVYPYQGGNWDLSRLGPQEYSRRPGKDDKGKPTPIRDDQRRTVTAWVRPGHRFELDLSVDDISVFELGGLAYLLALNDGQEASSPTDTTVLAAESPLGFGSVVVDVVADASQLTNGAHLGDALRSLDPQRYEGRGPVPTVLERARQTFASTVAEAHGTADFEAVPFIAAFVQAATGFEDGLPTHYPRTDPSPNRDARSYEWFVENDRTATISWLA